MLRARLGEIDDRLAAVIPALLELPEAELALLLLHEERDRLLARFEE